MAWSGAALPMSQSTSGGDDGVLPDLAARESTLGIGPQTPVLMDPDLGVDSRLVGFFTSPTFQAKSESTRRTYGFEYRTWLDFLWPKDWAEATEEDVASFKLWRTSHAMPPGPVESWDPSFFAPGRRVSGATWNKSVAALEVLYSWAANPRRGYVSSSPLRDVSFRVPGGRGGRATGSTVRAKDARAHRYRWISPATFRVWVDVGLRGFDAVAGSDPGKLAVGLPSVDFRGRNVGRNVAGVELAYLSGLRREEFGSLLACEVPERGLAEVKIADVVAKGGRGRRVLVPDAALASVARYVSVERHGAVVRGQRRGRYADPALLWVEAIEPARGGSQRISIRGAGWHDLNDLGVAQRVRLMRDGPRGPEPLWLFLNEMGRPFRPKLWCDPFEQASARVSDQGRRVGAWGDGGGLRVTPHSLRFSFALMYLLALHQSIDELDGVTHPGEYDPRRYRHAYERVASQLGHASVTTTMTTYLAPFEELRFAGALLRAHDGISAAMSALASSDARVLDLR